MTSRANPGQDADTVAESKAPHPGELPPAAALAGPGFGDDGLIAGRYEILALLGRGGMGTVYRARDRELDEVVALKVLRRDLLDAPGMLERFRREVKLSRRVTDRHVARAFDIGEHGEARFLTMEFVDGEPLSELIARDGRLPLRRVVAIGSALCEGLSAAHAAGVIHRDLKPGNVLIARGGRVVITDFGIARALDDGGARTVGVAVGTPAYMAPEQLEASSEIDERADIFALGVILFRLLTGALPWKGASPYITATLRLSEPAPDPRVHCPELPEAAARLVLRCLARAPEGRFASAILVREALAAVPLEDRPRTEPPPPEGAPATLVVPTERPLEALAVLPFRSAASDDDEYLADGLTEDLIDLLSMTSGLRVRPRGVVMPLRGQSRDVRELGRELGVQVVVEGSLRKAGDSVRVSTRLISVQDGFQLWARRFDVPSSDLLAVSDQIAQAITTALTVQARHLARSAPTDPAALDAYFRARHEYHKFDRLSVLRSVDLFDRARALAPDDAMILTGYALARARLWFFGAEGSGERAREAAERAVALAPTRGEPYAALATVKWNLGEVEGAVRLLRKALTHAPSLADAHDMMGRILSETGPLDRGLEHLETAIALEPARHEARMSAARVHALTGRWERALALLAEGRRGQNQNAWVQTARLIAWRPDGPERARELLGELSAAAVDPLMPGLLLRSVIAPLEGLDPSAHMHTGSATVHASWRTRSVISQFRVEIAARIGQAERALAALEEADAAGLMDSTWLDLCPLIHGLRAEPRLLAVQASVSQRAARVREAL